jgi:signal transduction histidine kinase
MTAKLKNRNPGSLLNRFSRSVVIWLLPVVMVSGVLGYFMIKYISSSEVNEFLTYEMERIIDYSKVHNDLPQYQMVADILPGKKSENPFFRDTLILETGDMEMAPYRELLFPLAFDDGEYTIVLRHLLLDRESVIKGTLLVTFGLSMLIFIVVLGIVPLVARNVWSPFYTSLGLLRGFHPEKPLPEFPQSDIAEFSEMNDSVGKLLVRVKQDYQKAQEFNDNTSHEMQTQLAIIKATTENMLSIDEKSVPQEWAEQINKIHQSASRLSQIQRSLLLLSRIGNREFDNNQWIDLKIHLESTLHFFDEMIQMRDITVNLQLDDCKVYMDPGLANVLINNLVKNAVKHNFDHGFIDITLREKSLRISNPGIESSRSPETMKRRFAKGPSGNRGIGLAIVDQICSIYDFAFQYKTEEENLHVFEIFFK